MLVFNIKLRGNKTSRSGRVNAANTALFIRKIVEKRDLSSLLAG